MREMDTDNIDGHLNNKIRKLIKVGDVFFSPNKSKNKISRITNEKIYYVKQRSETSPERKISLPINEIQNVWIAFSGKACTATELKHYNPKVFDSKCSGHSCNCVFLFLIAEKLGLLERSISGRGVGEYPFFVVFRKWLGCDEFHE